MMTDDQAREMAQQELLKRGIKPPQNAQLSEKEMAMQELERRGIQPPSGRWDKLKSRGEEAKSILAGAKEGGRRFISGVRDAMGAYDYNIRGKEYAAQLKAEDKAALNNFNARYEGDPNAKTTAFLTEIVPSLVMGNKLNAAKPIMKIANLGKNAGLLGKGAAYAAGMVPKNAGIGAVNGGLSYDPTFSKSVPEKAAQGALVGGLLGPVMGGMAQGVEKGFNKFRPGNLFTHAGPEQVAKNAGLAGNLPMGLGDVLENPNLKRMQENVLSRIPLSGVSKTQQIVGNALKEQGDTLLGKLAGGKSSADIGRELQNSLLKTAEIKKGIKSENYTKANEFADSKGVAIKPKNYTKAINEATEWINENVIDRYKREKMNHLVEDSFVNLKNGFKDNGVAFKKSYLMKASLNKIAKEAYHNGDDLTAGLINRLKSGLIEDVNETVKNSGSKKLQNLYNKAEDYYKNTYAPTKDRDITKFTERKGDSDILLSNFIKGGANDRGNLLNKLTAQLPPKDRKLAAYGYFSSATDPETGAINPQKIAELYKKLGTKQRTALFDPATRKELDRYTSLVKMNGEALSRMKNPQTGQRTGDLLLQGGLGLGGGLAAGLTGSAAAIGAGILGGRVTNALLTSPKVRDYILKSIQRGDRRIPDSIKNMLAVTPETLNR